MERILSEKVALIAGGGRGIGAAAISIGTAKAGLVAFARYIAKEYGPYGIIANVASPAMVETELSSRIPPEQKQRISSMTPLG